MKYNFNQFIDDLAKASGQYALCEAVKKGYKIYCESDYDSSVDTPTDKPTGKISPEAQQMYEEFMNMQEFTFDELLDMKEIPIGVTHEWKYFFTKLKSLCEHYTKLNDIQYSPEKFATLIEVYLNEAKEGVLLMGMSSPNWAAVNP